MSIQLLSTIIEKGEKIDQIVEQTAAAVANSAAGASGAVTDVAQPTGFFGSGILGMVLYIGGLIALFYFFAIRPQKKKEKELVNMQNSIKVGDSVVTSSGFYGKVVDVTDEVFVVEFGTNKGVRIPVRKREVIDNKEPNLSNKPVEK